MTTREQLVDETEELAIELFERSHEPSFPDDSQGMKEARDWARSILDRFAKPITAEQVEAVLALHRKKVRTARMKYYCGHCGDEAGWPCSTVRAIEEAA